MKKLINEEKLLELRNQGLTSKEIGDFFGVSGNHINKMLNWKFGLKAIEPCKNNRRYSINHDFFDEPNKEEVSYFLGLLWADGNVSEKTTSVALALVEKDKYILEKLAFYVQPEKPLNYREVKKGNSQNQYKCVINSKKIKEKLISYGCGPRKTFNLDWPKINFDENNIRHFIRGFLDGDGCVFIPENLRRIYIGFVGDIVFLSALKDIIESRLDITCSLSKEIKGKAKNIRMLCIYGGKQAETFGDYIYKDSNIFLNRKYDKYLKIKNRPNKKTKNG
jgi:hypothetical protein